MLSSDQKKYLRSKAHSLSALLQIGKGGLSENLYTSLDSDLEAHELVKVSLLKSCEVSVREAAIECAAATHSQVVQIIGHTFVLYRRSKENRLGL